MNIKGKVWKAWCGFVDGKPQLATETGRGNLDQYGEGLFRTRREAREGFGDVRKVRISVIPRPRRKVNRRYPISQGEALELLGRERTPKGKGGKAR